MLLLHQSLLLLHQSLLLLHSSPPEVMRRFGHRMQDDVDEADKGGKRRNDENERWKRSGG